MTDRKTTISGRERENERQTDRQTDSRDTDTHRHSQKLFSSVLCVVLMCYVFSQGRASTIARH